MLQIYIEHYKDETVLIQSIQSDKTILAEFENDNINLDVCIPFIGQEIKVHHIYVDDCDNSYVLTAKLESVEIDSITNVKCIKYSPISN